MKRTSDVTILGTVVYGVSISTTTFTLRSRTSLGSTQMNNQSKASKSDRYWVMTSEKRSPTYVVYHFDTQRLSPTRVCKKCKYLMKLILDINVIGIMDIFCFVLLHFPPARFYRERLWFESLNRIKGHQYLFLQNCDICLECKRMFE